MPSSVKIKHRNTVCSFTEADHKYWTGPDDDEKSKLFHELISVSTLVHQFQQPFDEAKVARNVALREGRKESDVIADWHRKRDTACEFGTRVHETAEDCLHGRDPRNKPRDGKEKRYFGAAWRFGRELYGKYTIAGIEKMVFSETLGVAGTIDLLLKNGNDYYVADWKTNENLKKQAFNNFLPPFQHLPADSLTTYSLQLEMYRLILKAEGFVNGSFGRGKILWIRPDCDDPDAPVSVEVFDTKPLGEEAAMMMALRASTPWYREWLARCPF